MRKRKRQQVENSVANLSDTSITKVIEDTTDNGIAPSQSEPAEPSQRAGELAQAYKTAIEKVRAALMDYGQSVWRLAWALVDFRAIHEQLHPDDRLSDQQIASVLGINLSPARIGQLINTALAFPREQVDQSIDFRVYEEARKLTANKARMTPEKRLALVKKYPTTAKIAKIKPAPVAKASRGNEVANELVIRIVPGEGDNLSGTACLNGQEISIPAELLSALRAYAAKLFVDTRGGVESTA